MNKEIKYLLSICLLSIPLFWLGNAFNPHPGQTSGNGNPAIVIIWVLFVVFLTMIYFSLKIINKYSIKRSFTILGVFVISVHLIVSFLYQRNSFSNYKGVLANAYEEQFGFIDWQYIDQISSFLSIHVNAQIFNVNTYFMFITSAILISLLLSFIPQVKRLQFVN